MLTKAELVACMNNTAVHSLSITAPAEIMLDRSMMENKAMLTFCDNDGNGKVSKPEVYGCCAHYMPLAYN
jgi:hypothetical protein